MADNTRLKDLSFELKCISDMIEHSNHINVDQLGRLESSMSYVDHLETSSNVITRAMDALTKSIDCLQHSSANPANNLETNASSTLWSS